MAQDSLMQRVRNRIDVHVTRVAMTVVAVLSFGIGVLHIGAETVEGPFGMFVPLWIQEITGFTGAVTGFLVLLITAGLWHRYRIAWQAAVAVIPLVALQGILQSSMVSFLLIGTALFALGALLMTRQQFHRRVDLPPTQIAALAALIGSVIYGMVGSYALRNEFSEPLTLLDAFYYTVVTMSTVGYGDVYPVSDAARLFAVSLIVVGAGSFAAFIGTLLGPLMEKHISPRITRRKKPVDNDADASE